MKQLCEPTLLSFAGIEKLKGNWVILERDC